MATVDSLTLYMNVTTLVKECFTITKTFSTTNQFTLLVLEW